MAGKRREEKGREEQRRAWTGFQESVMQKRTSMIMVMPQVKDEVRRCWRRLMGRFATGAQDAEGFARRGTTGRGGSYSGSSELARGGSAFRSGIWRGVWR
jgi:hypothetical protein